MVRNRSSLDPGQIVQSVFNEDSLSYDVTIIDTEMNMSLSADEGDSIKVEARSLNQKVKSNEEFNISNIAKLRIYLNEVIAGSEVELEVSPEAEGDLWFSQWKYNMTSGQHMSQCIEDIMAVRARVKCPSGSIIVIGKGD